MYQQALRDGSWRRWHRQKPRDGDLAAHAAMTRARGAALIGPPPATALPAVPARDLADSLLRDGRWAARLSRQDPGMEPYAVLNSCRRLALFRRGFLLSKAEGADWGLAELPARWHPVITAASRRLPHRRTGSFLRWMAVRERKAVNRGAVRLAGR